MIVIDDSQMASFKEHGFAGPFDLVDPSATGATTKTLRRDKFRMFFWSRVLDRLPVVTRSFPIARWGAAKWHLGLQAISPTAHGLGIDPRIVDRVAQIIGPDVLLCGSMMIVQPPGVVHPFHVDVEHWDIGGLTIWIGLDNITPNSTMQIVTGSHHLHAPAPEGATPEQVLAHAQQRKSASGPDGGSDCRILNLPCGPGQFCILDSHTWHSTRNDTQAVRTSLILLYCPAHIPVRWPVSQRLGAPHVLAKTPYPVPCTLVAGEDRHGLNLIMEELG